MAEWFRRETWSAKDAADFEERLLRTRSHSRAQYLRLQAVHLADAKRPHHEVALGLLDRLLREHPDCVELAQIHSQRAESLVALGRIDDAIAAFRAAFAAERARPNVRTTAYLQYAYLVATQDLQHLFNEAREVLAEFGTDEVFAYQLYYHSAALALISSRAGDNRSAARFAKAALDAAARTKSPFPRHPTFGLVTRPDPSVLKHLASLVAG